MDKILRIQGEIDQLYKVEASISYAISLGEVYNKSDEEKNSINQAYGKVTRLLDIKRNELKQAVIEYDSNS